MQEPNQLAKAFNKDKWLRGFYMAVLLICGWIAAWLVVVVTVFQFLSNIFTDKSNEHILRFSRSLIRYITQIVQYVTYNAEEKPFPFSGWPKE
jgi:hypothetical protein